MIYLCVCASWARNKISMRPPGAVVCFHTHFLRARSIARSLLGPNLGRRSRTATECSRINFSSRQRTHTQLARYEKRERFNKHAAHKIIMKETRRRRLLRWKSGSFRHKFRTRCNFTFISCVCMILINVWIKQTSEW